MTHAQRQTLRPNLATIIPDRMRKRPLDARGYPVPWFVAWVDGRPDFRIMDPQKYQLALDKRRCWLCGTQLGKYATFVLGLMCLVNRISAEPPSHMECAKFAVRGCPFLTIPTAQYRDAKLPTNTTANPDMLTDNPEVSALWTCDTWQAFHSSGNNVVAVGDPRSVTFWTKGRQATDQEVVGTFWKRLTILQLVADEEGGSAPARLVQCVEAALFWLPDPAGSA